MTKAPAKPGLKTHLELCAHSPVADPLYRAAKLEMGIIR